MSTKEYNVKINDRIEGHIKVKFDNNHIISGKFINDKLTFLNDKIIFKGSKESFSVIYTGNETVDTEIICFEGDNQVKINPNFTTMVMRMINDQNEDRSFFDGKPRRKAPNVQTELHTHLIEMLPGKEFIEFILKYTKIPVTKDYKIIMDEKNEDAPGNTYIDKDYYDTKLSEDDKRQLANQITFDLHGKHGMCDLANINKRRRVLLDYVMNSIPDHKDVDYNRSAMILLTIYDAFKAKDFDGNKVDDSLKEYLENLNQKTLSRIEKRFIGLLKQILDLPKNDKYKNTLKGELLNCKKTLLEIKKRGYVYSLLLKEGLLDLANQGIQYTEISYSTSNIIDEICCYHLDGIKSDMEKKNISFNLLKSVDRLKMTTYVSEKDKTVRKKEIDEFKELLSNNKINGIDIMGTEKPISDNEIELYKESFKEIIEFLYKHPSKPPRVFRIHAGEAMNCTENVYRTLKIIDDIIESNPDFELPLPFQLRIGHSINIKKNRTLINLLRKYNCIVELNLTSNYTLSSLPIFRRIPIRFYEKNNIRFVLSTDGGGVYSTSSKQEAEVFSHFPMSEEPSSTTPEGRSNFDADLIPGNFDADLIPGNFDADLIPVPNNSGNTPGLGPNYDDIRDGEKTDDITEASYLYGNPNRLEDELIKYLDTFGFANKSEALDSEDKYFSFTGYNDAAKMNKYLADERSRLYYTLWHIRRYILDNGCDFTTLDTTDIFNYFENIETLIKNDHFEEAKEKVSLLEFQMGSNITFVSCIYTLKEKRRKKYLENKIMNNIKEYVFSVEEFLADIEKNKSIIKKYSNVNNDYNYDLINSLIAALNECLEQYSNVNKNYDYDMINSLIDTLNECIEQYAEFNDVEKLKRIKNSIESLKKDIKSLLKGEKENESKKIR